MIDIVFPKNNEKEFLKIAEKLGYKNLCFVYPYKTKIKKIESKKINIFYGVLAKPNESQKAKSSLVIVKSSDKDRDVFERVKPDIIFGLEASKRKDFMHHRNSGLNQILCKLATKNKIIVAFPLKLLLGAEKMLRAQFIGRIKQNIKLCRKYKVKTIIASFGEDPYEMRAPSDLISLGISFGMHPKEAKEALQNTLDKINLNIKKKGKDYIAEGIELVS
ncbi:hypothetical protein HQ529_00530 [Candidatus Woesearchaeota archaeon]|nr:hypothetical protein [Candidatus Woesearchaeota archaeon]